MRGWVFLAHRSDARLGNISDPRRKPERVEPPGEGGPSRRGPPSPWPLRCRRASGPAAVAPGAEVAPGWGLGQRGLGQGLLGLWLGMRLPEKKVKPIW